MGQSIKSASPLAARAANPSFAFEALPISVQQSHYSSTLYRPVLYLIDCAHSETLNQELHYRR